MLLYFMRGSFHLKGVDTRGLRNWGPEHKDMLLNCAQSILSLSANAGTLTPQLQVSLPVENRLVREGPLSELNLQMSKDPKVRWALLKTIFNLAGKCARYRSRAQNFHAQTNTHRLHHHPVVNHEYQPSAHTCRACGSKTSSVWV